MNKQNFNFDQFLMENGFAYTNYGTHQLYEFTHDGHNYAVNLQGKKMNTNQSRTSELLNDVAVPATADSAEKWLNDFLGRKAESKPAAKPKSRAAKK